MEMEVKNQTKAEKASEAAKLVSAQATQHMAEYLEGGFDWEAEDIAAAKPHGLEAPISAAWQATKRNLPEWLASLNPLRDDWDLWLPVALEFAARGKVSPDAVAKAAELAFEGGETNFREALASRLAPVEEAPQPKAQLPTIIPPAPPLLAPNLDDALNA